MLLLSQARSTRSRIARINDFTTIIGDTEIIASLSNNMPDLQ